MKTQPQPLKSWRPGSRQIELLHAVLAPSPAQARALGLAWLEAVEVETLDTGSSRLLALLYWRLLQAGTEHPEMPRLKGVYRHAWASVTRYW